MAAMKRSSLRARVMMFSVFPSEIGEHDSPRPETVSCFMKLNSYPSNKVSTEDLKTEMSLRKVLISATTDLGFHLTGRLKIQLTAEATGRTFPLNAWRLMSLLCLSNVTTCLSQNPSELWRKWQRAEISALSHVWHPLPNTFSAQVSFSFKKLCKEKHQVIYSFTLLLSALWRGENHCINTIFSRKKHCC